MNTNTRDYVRNVAVDNGYELDGDLGGGSPSDAFIRNGRRVAIKFSRANDRVLKVAVNGADVRGNAERVGSSENEGHHFSGCHGGSDALAAGVGSVLTVPISTASRTTADSFPSRPPANMPSCQDAPQSMADSRPLSTIDP